MSINKDTEITPLIQDNAMLAQLERRIEKLERRIEQLERELHSIVAENSSEKIQKSDTKQRSARDEVVMKAKRDVEELMRIGYDADIDLPKESPFHNKFYRVQFFVNQYKRTVVALIHVQFSDEVKARGIAKCAPSDCFNVWVGKAIALRRALGLEVPDEYLNAPQPTVARVGDIVKYGSKLYKVIDPEQTEYVKGETCLVGGSVARCSLVYDDSDSAGVDKK